MSDCLPCLGLNCDFPSDLSLYSLDGLDYFLSGGYSFVLECPPGYYCPGFPVPWRVPPGEVPPVRFTTPTGGAQRIPLRIRCCENQYVTSQVIVSVQPGPVNSGSVSGNIVTSSSGVYGTVLIVGSPATSLVQNTIRTIVQLVVDRMQPLCAQLRAACDAQADDRIFPPDDPRNPTKHKPGHVSLRSMSVSEGCINVRFQANIAARSRNAPVRFSLLSGSLPTGLSIVQIGPRAIVISGTPTAAGSFTFTLLAQDPIFVQDRREYTICIIDISPATLPDGTVGTPYSQTLSATACATAPLSWQITQGSLPSGLSLDEETGVISGTPTQVGNFTFLVLLQTAAT